MNNDEIYIRIKKLREELNRHNYLYYVLNRPEISDYEYDLKMNELIRLEKENPQYFDPNSPTQRVGDDTNQEFVQREHKYPMLSLGNTYSFEEIIEFNERVKKSIGFIPEYVCELKYDGAAISITYIDGRLAYAVTRGDGNKGDDVTANVKTIKSIPLILIGDDYPDEFEIRGEIIIANQTFEKLNKQREEEGEALFANPRNAAAGTLKIQNSSIVAKRPLDCFLYFILGDNLPFNSHFENINKAKEWGFKIPPYIKKCSKLEEVFQFINYWDNERKNLPFNIDGVVIKVNDYELQKQLGNTAKTPRWAIAYKFKAEQAYSKLVSIDFQVGRTGAITPVANLEPVFLAGTTIKRASLHNADQIEMLDVRIGDTVIIEKGGEIIPKIVGVDLSKRPQNSNKVIFIDKCPECGTTLIKNEGEAKHYCPNEFGCPPQIKGKIEHFVSRKAMDIACAEATIELLYNQGLIKDSADLYYLKKEQLVELERFGERSAHVLLESIENSKKVAFNRVIFALGIRFVGENVAKTLAANFNSIDELASASFEQLTNIEEIGEKIAESILMYFSEERNKLLIEKLKNAGVNLKSVTQTKIVSEKLKGKTFVISGTFKNHSRDELKELIEINGGKNLSSVSSKTDFLLAGENIGPSKLEKAKQFNIRIISEKEFEELIS
jgi:DNA ligase (NAD+)